MENNDINSNIGQDVLNDWNWIESQIERFFHLINIENIEYNFDTWLALRRLKQL